jgi:hypothetical protein
MRSAVNLSCLLVVLCLVLVWEIVAPRGGTSESGADGFPSQDTAAPPRASATPAAGTAAADAGALTSVAVSIVERPLFTPGRRAPGKPARTAAAEVMIPAGLPRLTGVIVGPSDRRAIFTGIDGKSRAAAEGDAVGTFKVRTIGPGLVTLSGSEGDRVLRPAYVAPTTAGHAAAPGEIVGSRSREGER